MPELTEQERDTDFEQLTLIVIRDVLAVRQRGRGAMKIEGNRLIWTTITGRTVHITAQAEIAPGWSKV